MELTLDSTDLKQEHRNCNTSLTSFDKFRPEVQAAIRAVGHAMFRSNGNHNAIYLPKPKVSEPLALTTTDYWQELDKMAKDDKLPFDLALILKHILVCHLNKCVTPLATTHTIDLVRKHLSGGILLRSSGDETLLAVAVFEPDPENREKSRTFFQLIRTYPGGRIRICE